jgi:hypothetical protein
MYYKDNDTLKTVCVVSAILVVVSIIVAFICIPVKGYMEVDSYHWNWTINVYEYGAVNKSTWGKEEFTSKWDWFSERTPSSYDMERSLPSGAYNVSYELKKHHSYSNENTTTVYYRFYYTYTINEWVPITKLSTYGNDKNPYEHECDLPTDVENPNLGDRKRQYGHEEEYTATGVVNGETTTVIITKDIFDRLTENDEFEYKRHRWNGVAYDIKIAE